MNKLVTEKSGKKLGYRAISTILEFLQLMIQGLWTNMDPLLQLPSFEASDVKKVKTSIKQAKLSTQGFSNIELLCRMSAEERKKLNLFDGDEAKYSELEKVVKAMPLVSVSAKAFTEGEEKMTSSDFSTMKFETQFSVGSNLV